MADGTVEIRPATWDDAERVAAVVTLAFAADPYVRWLHPDAASHVAASMQYPGVAYGAAFDRGTVDVTADFGGAALWLPPGAEAGSETPRAVMGPLMDPDVIPAFEALTARSAAFCPDAPHWHLGLIAVDPARRGRGYGQALMAHGLARCDRDGLGVFLESTNPANVSLYRRFGFEVLADLSVDGSPRRIPMWRPPRR